ncbi:hypothetical protein VNO78_18427 [Psophocarpus tetragonolobus]|uniref:Uncharacterized protein n=1 Tax=Psophocarpus tetragonolobus TaxID=3891 RepID=A0AAN9XLU3_PSOTE
MSIGSANTPLSLFAVRYKYKQYAPLLISSHLICLRPFLSLSSKGCPEVFSLTFLFPPIIPLSPHHIASTLLLPPLISLIYSIPIPSYFGS